MQGSQHFRGGMSTVGQTLTGSQTRQRLVSQRPALPLGGEGFLQPDRVCAPGGGGGATASVRKSDLACFGNVRSGGVAEPVSLAVSGAARVFVGDHPQATVDGRAPYGF